MGGDAQTRAHFIDRSIEGSKEKLVHWVPLFWVTYYEQKRMHRLFAKWRFTYKGSGKTEWFQINRLQAIKAVVYMNYFYWRQRVLIVLWVALLLLGGIGFYDLTILATWTECLLRLIGESAREYAGL